MMEIAGKLRSLCTPEELVAVLSDVEALAQFLPAETEVQETATGSYSFVVSREFGPIKLTLPGQMTISAAETGQGRRLSVRAAHIIGGKVDLELDLAFQPVKDTPQTLVTYSGALKATGLAGRIARDRRARLNSVVRSGMVHLAHLAETRAGRLPVGDKT